MTPATTKPERRRSSAPHLAVVVVAFVVTCAGLLALGQADALTATGSRIKELEDQRARLHEQRSEALLRLAAATDPRTLHRRVGDMGFGDAAVVEFVRVPGLPVDDAIAADSFPASPLNILLESAGPSVAYDPSGLVRMMAVADGQAPRSAMAAETQ